MPGRIEIYLHSDATLANKGGCMVCVTCQTDFAAQTEEFVHFARRAAQFAYACKDADGRDGQTFWDIVSENFAEVEKERLGLQESLKEKISVRDIRILTVDEPVVREETEDFDATR